MEILIIIMYLIMFFIAMFFTYLSFKYFITIWKFKNSSKEDQEDETKFKRFD